MWLDTDVLTAAAGDMSAGEQAVVAIAVSLLDAGHPVALGDAVTRLDRDTLVLVLAFAAAGWTLWQAWRPGPLTNKRLTSTAVSAGLFWAAQIPAPLFPGSAVVDEDNPV